MTHMQHPSIKPDSYKILVEDRNISVRPPHQYGPLYRESPRQSLSRSQFLSAIYKQASGAVGCLSLLNMFETVTIFPLTLLWCLSAILDTFFYDIHHHVR